MSINLLEMLQGQIGDTVIDQASKFLGENSSVTKSGFGALLPTIISGVISKGSSESGASGIIDMITKGNHDGGILDNIGDMFGGGSSTSNFMNAGSLITSALFGGSKLGGILDVVTQMTGMRRSSSSSLMNLIAPMVMGMIGKYVRKNGLNAKGLMDMLMGQKETVSAAMPSEIAGLMGWSAGSAGSVVETAKTMVKETASAATVDASSSSSERSGGSVWRWAIPLVLLLGIGWWLFNRGGAEKVTDVAGDGVEMVGDAANKLGDATTTTVNAAGDAVTNAAGAAVDAAGNAVEATGDAMNAAADKVAMTFDQIIEKAKAQGWSHTVDATGNLVDVSTGKVVAKAGEWSTNAEGAVVDAAGKTMSNVSKFGNAIKSAMVATGDAVEGAAKATGEAMDAVGQKAKATFSKMFSSGSTATADKPYLFSNIEWDGTKITNYNKSEFMALSQSLMDNPEAKITVQAFADNKATAKARAEHVMRMLSTVGVKKGQISAKGMVEEGKGNVTQMVVAQ